MKPGVLGALVDWPAVVSFFEVVSDPEAFRHRYPKLENSDRSALLQLRFGLGGASPYYDLERDSLQARILRAMEIERNYSKPWERLYEENAKRRFKGFEHSSQKFLGVDWAALETGFEAASTASLISFLPDYGRALLDNEADDRRLPVGSYVRYAVEAAMKKPLKPLKKKNLWGCFSGACIRHWCNPDFPLWLMTDRALVAAMAYLAPGAEIRVTSVQSSLDRVGLSRLKYKPISKFKACQDARRIEIGLVSYIRKHVTEVDSIWFLWRGALETKSFSFAFDSEPSQEEIQRLETGSSKRRWSIYLVD